MRGVWAALLIAPPFGIGSELAGIGRNGPSIFPSSALAARIEATPWQFVGQELPQFSVAPTDHYSGGLRPGSVGMRLFTVSQRGGYAPMIGGLGYVLATGVNAYSMKTIAAKDVWVQPLTRARAVAPVPIELPVVTGSGTRTVSSPRVLSDLFWTGRYAERAEDMARLLTITRERYHEYRHRQYLDASECVPVLLAALGGITGTDTGVGAPDDAVDHAETIAVAPTTLWALTADRTRSGSLAQSVERLGWPLAPCATRCPTTPGWCSPPSTAPCSTSRPGRRNPWYGPTR